MPGIGIGVGIGLGGGGGGGASLTASASSFLASASTGALIAALSNPFVGATTYEVVGTTPGQLALSGGSINKGASAATGGQAYSLKVRAISADGLREVAETLTFTAVTPTPTPTPTPTVTTLTRQFPAQTYGSSSYTDTSANSTTNAAGTAVPSEYVGISIVGRILQKTLPTDAATAPVISVRAEAGTSEVQVRDKLVTTDAGTHAGKVVSFQMGGNPSISTWQAAEANLHAMAVDCANTLTSEGAKAVITSPAFTTSSNFKEGVELMPLHEVRQAKLVKEANRPNFLKVSMSRALKRWDAPNRTADDIVKQKRDRRPLTLVETSGGVHLNGQGYARIGDEFVHLHEALAGGPVYIPDEHLSGVATGAGQKVCNVPYAGTLAGCTFVSADPSFTFTVNASGTNGPELELRLTGTPPKRAMLDVTGVIKRTGYQDRPFIFSVSVISRTGTASATTRFSGRADIASPLPVFPGSSRKLTGFVVFAREEDAGNNPALAGGTSDTRTHWLYKSPSMEIYTVSGGTVRVTANDTTGGTTRAFTVSNFSSWAIARGKRCLSFSFDADAVDGVPLKMRASAATGSAATTTHTGTTPGNGNIDLARAGTTVLGSSSAFVSSAEGLDGADYFNGTLDLLWLSSGGALDVRDPAIEALVYNAATATCVDLGASGQVAGLTPNVLFRHSAAEYTAGSAATAGSTRGWATAKNDGTGGDFFCRPQGYLETV